MSEFIKNFIRASMILVVVMLIATNSRSGDMNFVGKSQGEPSKREKLKMRKNKLEGGTFYLQTNMWNEADKDILSINFHRGDMIPVGSEVMINSVGKKSIDFLVKSRSIQYTLILSRKHSKLDIFELVDRYFGTDDPLKGKYKKFSAEEKASIKSGIIKAGMSKDAVVMSYGYPPTHRTPTLQGDLWNYWSNRVRRFEVYFVDDKVVRLKGITFE